MQKCLLSVQTVMRDECKFLQISFLRWMRNYGNKQDSGLNLAQWYKTFYLCTRTIFT